jgi:hypothetical protein
MYIGQTGQSTDGRVKVHHWHIWFRQPSNVTVPKHELTDDHHFCLQDTNIFSIKPCYVDQIIVPAT